MHMLRLGGPLRALLRDSNTAPRGAEPCLQAYTLPRAQVSVGTTARKHTP